MKYLLIIAIVIAVIWLTRAARGRVPPPVKPPVKPDATPAGHEEMVACAHCGIHLPLSEATTSAGAVYCGEPHRLAHERNESPR